MIVYVEKKVLEDPAIASDDNFGPVKKKFCTFREGVLQPPALAAPCCLRWALGHPEALTAAARLCLLPDYDDISNQIDFIICLGGDGTLLYASSLFQVSWVWV